MYSFFTLCVGSYPRGTKLFWGTSCLLYNVLCVFVFTGEFGTLPRNMRIAYRLKCFALINHPLNLF
jgi:hypothetical protein